jgi:hypothetical protein
MVEQQLQTSNEKNSTGDCCERALPHQARQVAHALQRLTPSLLLAKHDCAHSIKARGRRQCVDRHAIEVDTILMGVWTNACYSIERLKADKNRTHAVDNRGCDVTTRWGVAT